MDIPTLEDAQKQAVTLIEKLEGFKFRAYLDTDGKYHLGFGSGTDDVGRPFKENDTCTFAQATAYLNYHLLKWVYPELKEFDLPPKIYAAVCSLIYNAGSLGPTIRNVLTLRKWDRLPDCFREYVVVNGRVSDALKARREKEIAYFKTE